MGSLVPGLVALDRGMSFCSRVISGGASNLVADETFVVLDVFCPLYWSEVDLVDVHHHRILRVFSGSWGGWDIVCSSSWFLHLYGCIIELTGLVEPKFVRFWFFE